MKLLRTIRFDASDDFVFETPAGADEWAVSGGFEFAGAQPGSLSGKRRQAFANGFLSLQGFGRSTFAAVADIGAQEREDLETALARHFVAVYGAPDLDTALPAAREEIGFICDLVADAPINTVFTVRRFHDDDGEIREEYRTVAPPSAPTHTRIWDVVDDHDA